MPEENELNKILSDLVIYLYPEYLKSEYAGQIRLDKIDKHKLNKYFRLLFNVKNAYEKIKKYPLYFAEFYPNSSKIKDYEALEHHIHSYLEDLNILKNKIEVFLGELKNDLKKIATNKKEIENALEIFRANMTDVFNDVSRHRNPHNHRGSQFLDPDIVNAKGMDTILEADSNLVNKLIKPEGIEILKEKKQEFFSKAKSSWVSRAIKNSSQIDGLIQHVFKQNKDFLYKLLDIARIEKLNN